MTSQKNLSDVRIINRANVLRLICERPGLTRQEISSELGITKMSVANIIAEYQEKGFIEERFGYSPENQLRSVGRPSYHVYNIPNSVIILSLFISETEITCSLVNFECKTLISHSVVPTNQENNQELLDKADELIALVMREGAIYMDRLRGIGISSVGLIDMTRGCIIGADNFPNIHNLMITDYFERKYDLPVLISNDMDASAVAERHYGRALDVENFIYMGVNSCIGLGIYINDAIYHGFNGFSGELGYTTVDYQGRRSDFGYPGLLESYVRIDQYVSQVNQDIIQRVEGLPNFLSFPVQWRDIAAAALDNNEYCLRIVRKIGDFLSIAVVNMLNLFDPEKIVLGGQIALAGSVIVDYIQKNARGKTLVSHFSQRDGSARHEEIPLELTAFSNQSAVIGAGAIFFDALFRGKLSLL